VTLHFVPAAAIATTYLIGTFLPLSSRAPHLLILMLAFACIGMPLQLGIIAWFSRSAGRPVVELRAPLPLWQHIAGAIVLICIDFAILQLPVGSISNYLATHVFRWLPIAFAPEADNDLALVNRRLLLPLLVAQLLIDGIINPIVEERYFRGFLLSQLVEWGFAAPVANTLFFAIAHFWQPYNYVSIFLFVLPLTLFTWWRKNYYAQAFVHCFANSFNATLALVSFLRRG
jgi:hypothetical protein